MEMIKKEDIKEVSHIKRLLEYCSLVPGFQERYKEDPYGVIKEIGVEVDPATTSFDYRFEKNNQYMVAQFPGTPAEKYANFLNNKVDMREEIKEECVPTNPTMKKWRERQIGRCNMELGAKVMGLVHSPFTIELADGCSIGCEFCGLNAGRLKSVFRYTDENAELFRNILKIAKEIMGDAAGHGTMYFASEPLDNPDYELFLKDYREIFGTLPQITTAAVMRHKDRMHELLKELNEYNGHIYRFSALSLDTVYEIMKEFTPEELVLVEVLPQFEGAPQNHFVNAGRQAKDGECDDTISCVSGFVVNMARKEIRLTTPASASPKHPTGEYILYKGNFTDAESFRETINMCIKKYMGFVLGPNEELRLRKNVTYDKKEEEYEISCKKGVKYKLPNAAKTGTIDLVGEILKSLSEGYKTKHQIVSELVEMEPSLALQSNLVFYFINKLWAIGIIEVKSGLI